MIIASLYDPKAMPRIRKIPWFPSAGYQEAADLFAKAVTWTWTQPRSVVTQRAFFETTRRLSAGVVVFEGRGSAQFRRLAVVAGVFTFKELGDS